MKQGHVYFIEAVGLGAIKIGWAISPERRLVLLGIGCPVELRLIAKAPGSLGHEGRIQTAFSADNIRGEWYRRTDRLDALMAIVSAAGRIPPEFDPAQTQTAESRGLAPLVRAIAALGSQAALARATGTTQANVSDVVRNGHRIPAHWCLKIEAATINIGSPVWRDELRPDIYPLNDFRYLHPRRRHDLRPDLYPDEPSRPDSPPPPTEGAAV